jgi:hypothetical protein
LRAALAEHREEVEHAPQALVQTGAARVAADAQVLLDRQLGEDPPPLHHLGDAGADDVGGAETVDALPVEPDRSAPDRPAVDSEQAGAGPQSRRLTRAVGAEQCDDPALRQLQAHPLEGEQHVVVDDLQVLEHEHRSSSSKLAGKSPVCPGSRRCRPLPISADRTCRRALNEGI